MQKKERHYLQFTKKEKNGIVVVSLINLLLYFSPVIYNRIISEKIPDQINYNEALAQLKINKVDSNKYSFYDNRNNKNHTYPIKSLAVQINLFEFDPNEISSEGWRKLGLKEKTIETIQKYLSKGGKFKKPEDIKKIWGLPEKLAGQLIPFVKIKVPNSPIPNQFVSKFKIKKPAEIIPIDINLADSTMFETLPFIGPTLAKRIVLYREKLGGFYSITQLAEVWGLQDSVFQKIKERVLLSDNNFKKIDINVIQLNDLKSHPYFGYKIANAIIKFRDQHGSFKSLDEIQKIVLIDEGIYNKIAHYLVVK
jgi:DNA uptake protein ComE-like DNA-binding protein